MRRSAMALVGSIGVHACLVWLGPSALVRTNDDVRDAREPIAFALVVSAMESIAPIDGETGKRRVGVERARPTGRPDDRPTGVAGSITGDRSAAVHARGEAAEEHITPDGARAAATALGALLEEMPLAPALAGTRDEAALGRFDTGSLVASGTRGLDMIGTGRGSGPSGEVTGTVGGGALGLGSLGAAHERAWIGGGPRGSVRSLCILRGCRPDRRPRDRVVVRVRVENGPLDRRIARRAVMRWYPALARCLDGELARASAQVVVSPNGDVAAVTAVDRCLTTALRRVAFPPESAPSRVAIDLERRD